MTTLARLAPYLGPRPFDDDEEDRARFFARDTEIEEIVALVLGHPLTVVYAQSGAGKTSIFNAAVLPRLRAEGFGTMPAARVGGALPRDAGEVANPYTFNVVSGLSHDTPASQLVATTLTDHIAATMADEEARVLVIDQFEELFTQASARGEAGRREFIQDLAGALAADPLLRVVLVLREEYIAQLEAFAHMLPERLRIRFRLDRLDFHHALMAVTAPLVGTGRRYDTGVAEHLVGELARIRSVTLGGESLELAGGYVEPVQLQVVCLGLWETLPPDADVITTEHVEAFGDVDQALGRFYESVVHRVADQGFDERQIRDWFSTVLITPLGTRGTVHRDETTGGLPNEAVDLLEAHHLIRGEFRSGARWYELTHDRLIEPINQRNAAWRQTLLVANPLAAGALTWERLERDRGSLLRGQSLTEAAHYAASPEHPLTDLERSFLDESLAERVRRRRRRALYLVTVAALIAALLLALLAVWQWNENASARRDLEEAQANLVAALADADELRRAAEAARNDAEDALADAEAEQAKAEAARLRAEDAEAQATLERDRAETEAARAADAAASAEAAAIAQEAARRDAEAALFTAQNRLDLLTRLAREPSTIGGSVKAGEVATHALEVPAGEAHLVATVTSITVPDQIGDAPIPARVLPLAGDEPAPVTRADLGLHLYQFEGSAQAIVDLDCYCAAVTRPSSGLWVLEVTSPVNVNYELTISFDPPITIRSMPGHGSIDDRGEVEAWRFTGEAGDELTVDVEPVDGSDLVPMVRVVDPGGTEIASAAAFPRRNAYAFVRLPVDGEYVVLVTTYDRTLGDYDIDTSPILTNNLGNVEFGTGVRGSIDRPAQTDRWTFEAGADQEITVWVRPTDIPDAGYYLEADVKILDPAGNPLVQGGVWPILVVTPTPGTYTVEIRSVLLPDYGGSWDRPYSTGGYLLDVSPDAENIGVFQRGPLVVGVPGSGSIDVPLQRDHWTFEGTAGQDITVTASERSLDWLDLTLQVFDPTGTSIATDDGGIDAELSLTLPDDGTYVIEVSTWDYASRGEYEVLVS